MKKIISIIVLAVLTLSLCACGESHDTGRFAGTWKSAVGDATLILNADGTATFIQDKFLTDAEGNVVTDDNNNPVKDPSNGQYTFLWTADSNSNITIKWNGEPVPALPSQKTEEETEAVTEPEVVVEDVVEGAVDVVEGAVDVVEGADGQTTEDKKKRDDPSVVGYGIMALVNGELVLYLSEGSSTDILLFTFNAVNVNPLKRIA